MKKRSNSCKRTATAKKKKTKSIEQKEFDEGFSSYDPNTASDRVHIIQCKKLIGTPGQDKYVSIINNRSGDDVELIKYNTGSKGSYPECSKTDIRGNKNPQYIDKRIFITQKANRSKKKFTKKDLRTTKFTASKDILVIIKKIAKK